jgi:hypothetical protein
MMIGGSSHKREFFKQILHPTRNSFRKMRKMSAVPMGLRVNDWMNTIPTVESVG